MSQSKKIKFTKEETMILITAISLAKESLLEKKELTTQRRDFRKRINKHLEKFLAKRLIIKIALEKESQQKKLP